MGGRSPIVGAGRARGRQGGKVSDEKRNLLDEYEWKLTIEKGGPGSGHWGHAGRPGQVGGSVSGSIAISIRTGRTARERQAAARAGGAAAQTDQGRRTAQVPTFKTTEEAEKWIENLGVADRVYLDGFDVRVAQEIAQSLANHKELIPDLHFSVLGNNRKLSAEMRKEQEPRIRQDMEERGKAWGWTQDRVDKWIKSHLRKVGIRMAPRAYAMAVGHAFFISYKYGKDYDGFRKSVASDVKNGWHPPGCDSVKAVIDHEIGHVIDSTYNRRASYKMPSLYREASKNPDLFPSRYARKDYGEFFAEGWAEYLNSPNPGSMAKRIGEIVMELTGEKK